MKKFVIILLTGILLLGLSLLNAFSANVGFLQAQESNSGNLKISLVGVIRGAGSPNYLQGASSIFVEGNYAYVTSGFRNDVNVKYDSALVIIDVSDPSNPT